MSDQIENRVIEAKSRGIYEAPGHGAPPHRLRAPALARSTTRTRSTSTSARAAGSAACSTRAAGTTPRRAPQGRAPRGVARTSRARSSSSSAAATTTRSSTPRPTRDVRAREALDGAQRVALHARKTASARSRSSAQRARQPQPALAHDGHDASFRAARVERLGRPARRVQGGPQAPRREVEPFNPVAGQLKARRNEDEPPRTKDAKGGCKRQIPPKILASFASWRFPSVPSCPPREFLATSVNRSARLKRRGFLRNRCASFQRKSSDTERPSWMCVMAVANCLPSDSTSIWATLFGGMGMVLVTSRPGEPRGVEPLERAPREHRVNDRGRHRARAAIEQELGRRSKMVPPVAISSSTRRQCLPVMSPMTFAGLAFSSSPERRLSMNAIGSRAAWRTRPRLSPRRRRRRRRRCSRIVLLEPLAQHRHRRQLIGRDREEALDLRRMQIDREHAIGAGGGEHVGHQAGRDRDARLVFLVASRVGKVRHHRGHPLAPKSASSASSRINSSTMCSESGGHAVCTTNTSCSRTFSSILTLRFSFENRVVCARPSGISSSSQISRASADATLRQRPSTPRGSSF